VVIFRTNTSFLKLLTILTEREIEREGNRVKARGRGREKERKRGGKKERGEE